MNKEDVLKRYRNEKNDEGILFALYESYRYGVGIFSLLFIIVLTLSLIKWRITDLYLLMTIFSGLYTGIICGYRKATHNKNLFLIILGMCFTILFLVCYIQQVL